MPNSSQPLPPQLPSTLLSQVPTSLHVMVENYWIDWCLSCAEKSLNKQQALDWSVLGKTWACSNFVARTMIRYPENFYSLEQEGFKKARNLEQYQHLVLQAIDSSHNEASLMVALRQLRQQEMLRIAWRDLNQLDSLTIIFQELTDLAEVLVAKTLTYLEQQQAEVFAMPVDNNAEPQALLVFAMGKMGGGELNFSSDIDLIFVFAEDGETQGKQQQKHHLSHYEFYLKLIRQLVKVLDEITADGFVYRVDTRLRPFGQSGPLAMSFLGFEQYYQLQGRDWERYAMIKGRLISGRAQDKKALQAMLTPFVYRRYLDFTMLESIREMKSMINAQMKQKQSFNNIKLGKGGIREIEFIAQTHQLIRAGREPELRARSLIKVLNLLAEKNYLAPQVVTKLIDAYWFLRKVENRLQMLNDQQTHVLPNDEVNRQRLCLAMDMTNWQQLDAILQQHQTFVDKVFQNLITPEQTTEEESGQHLKQVQTSAFVLFWENAQQDAVNDMLTSYLKLLGYDEVDEVKQQLQQLKNSAQVKQLTAESNRLLMQLMDSLLLKIVSYTQQTQLLERCGLIIKMLAGRKVYLSLLNEYPEIVQQMLKLCDASEWFSQHLSKHPILLDSLINSADVLQQKYDIKKLLNIELSRISCENLDQALDLQMERLRQFKHQTIFNIALLDVFYGEKVEKISDRLTELADAILEIVLDLAWQAMVQKYGVPSCQIEGEVFKPTLSIIAYGKMGGQELGYHSDLDIIFIHNSAGKQQQTNGSKVIDNSYFFARVAQRVVHILNTRTYSGILYECDTRLRPNGQSGLMVSSVVSFEQYQQAKAWTWEHQALIRARFVVGNIEIKHAFEQIKTAVLSKKRDKKILLQEVVQMREKMRQHLANKTSDFDIKQDTGGLVDIEFMTQAGILLFAPQCPLCLSTTATLQLIDALTTVAWYNKNQADQLKQAYRYFRKLKNWQNLRCKTNLDLVAQHRQIVSDVWHALMPKLTEDTPLNEPKKRE